mgnify:CR=1 FL=1
MSRLKKLTTGYIDIDIQCKPAINDNQIKIKVTDSGKGYSLDHQQLLKDQENHGRGLILIQKLCHKVTISNQGRTIEVIYKLN